MTITLKNVSIVNCDTGISAPADAAIHADGLNIVGCTRAIELRDPPSLLTHLGLAKNTPPEVLADVLRALQKPGLTQEQVTTTVRDSKLRSWLGAGADISAVGGGIFQLYQSNLVQNILAMMPK